MISFWFCSVNPLFVCLGFQKPALWKWGNWGQNTKRGCHAGSIHLWFDITFSKKNQQTLTCFCCRSHHSLTSFPESPWYWLQSSQVMMFLWENIPSAALSSFAGDTWKLKRGPVYCCFLLLSVQTCWISNCPCRENISASSQYYLCTFYQQCIELLPQVDAFKLSTS